MTRGKFARNSLAGAMLTVAVLLAGILGDRPYAYCLMMDRIMSGGCPCDQEAAHIASAERGTADRVAIDTGSAPCFEVRQFDRILSERAPRGGDDSTPPMVTTPARVPAFIMAPASDSSKVDHSPAAPYASRALHARLMVYLT